MAMNGAGGSERPAQQGHMMFSSKFPVLKLFSPESYAERRRPARRILHRNHHISAIAFFGAALLLAFSLAAQTPPASVQMPDNDPSPPGLDGFGGAHIDARMEARRISQLNFIRQKQMASEAQKLLVLAQKLNADANAGGTLMSKAERMRMASDIEKLAKSVKDKMTFAIGSPHDISQPYSMWPR